MTATTRANKALVWILILTLAIILVVGAVMLTPNWTDCDRRGALDWSVACINPQDLNSTGTAHCLATHGVPPMQTAEALPWWRKLGH